MQTRSRVAMLVVYLLLAGAGGIFIFDPAISIRSSFELYTNLVTIWGLFYVVGGLTSAISLGVRTTRSNLIATWYFEIAGLMLLVAATLVYAIAVFQAAFELDSLQVGAVAVVILAFATSLSIRVAEAFEIVSIVRKYLRYVSDKEPTVGE